MKRRLTALALGTAIVVWWFLVPRLAPDTEGNPELLQQAYKAAWNRTPELLKDITSIPSLVDSLIMSGQLPKHYKATGVRLMAGTSISSGNALFLQMGITTEADQGRGVVLHPESNSRFTTDAKVNICAEPVPRGLHIAEFVIDNEVLGVSQDYPFGGVWEPRQLGTFSVAWVGHFLDGSLLTLVSTNISIELNEPPIVFITRPESLRAGRTTKVQIVASDPAAGDDVGEVTLACQYQSEVTLLGKLKERPFEVSWTPARAGDYALQATATDLHAAKAYSETITVRVEP